MIRYVVHLPQNSDPATYHAIAERLKAAADDREWRDIILSAGATIEDMRPRATRPAVVRRAVARAR